MVQPLCRQRTGNGKRAPPMREPAKPGEVSMVDQMANALAGKTIRRLTFLRAHDLSRSGLVVATGPWGCV